MQGNFGNRHSSFFGLLNVAKYKYTRSADAARASFAIRALLEELRDETTIPTVSRCFPYSTLYPWPSLAGARMMNNQVTFNKCGNKNACPHCARVHGARMRKKFCSEFEYLVGEGYVPYWQTLELGYTPESSSIERTKLINSIWRQIQQTHRYRSLLSKHGLLNLRVTEFTYRDDSWTPHFHIVWMFKPGTDNSEAEAFLDEVSSLWRGFQNKNPLCAVNGGYVYSGPLDPDSSNPLGFYLFKAFYLKMDNGLVAKSDLPSSPFQSLVYWSLTGDMEHLRRWKDYEKTSSNLRRFKFSSAWNDLLP